MKHKTWKRKWLYNYNSCSYITTPKLKMWNGQGDDDEWIYVVNFTEQWAAQSLNKYYSIKESYEHKYTTQTIQNRFYRNHFNISLFNKVEEIRKPGVWILWNRRGVDYEDNYSDRRLMKVA